MCLEIELRPPRSKPRKPGAPYRASRWHLRVRWRARGLNRRATTLGTLALPCDEAQEAAFLFACERGLAGIVPVLSAIEAGVYCQQVREQAARAVLEVRAALGGAAAADDRLAVEVRRALQSVAPDPWGER